MEVQGNIALPTHPLERGHDQRCRVPVTEVFEPRDLPLHQRCEGPSVRQHGSSEGRTRATAVGRSPPSSPSRFQTASAAASPDQQAAIGMDGRQVQRQVLQRQVLQRQVLQRQVLQRTCVTISHFVAHRSSSFWNVARRSSPRCSS